MGNNRTLEMVLIGVGIVVLAGVLFYATQPPPGSTSGDNPLVVIETSMGDITVELFADKAPITVKNFLNYMDDQHYDGTIFHRVISTFMIQGGGFVPGMQERPTRRPIKNESSNGLRNGRGTLAMARTNAPDSATSQFFINVVNNEPLNRSGSNIGYAVFGKVTKGMDVVDEIKRVPTASIAGHDDVPKTDVIIKSVRRATTQPKTESKAEKKS